MTYESVQLRVNRQKWLQRQLSEINDAKCLEPAFADPFADHEPSAEAGWFPPDCREGPRAVACAGVRRSLDLRHSFSQQGRRPSGPAISAKMSTMVIIAADDWHG
jgi:hypothetical protein